MRIVINKTELAGALDWCAPIAGAKGQVPILTCALLDAKNDSVIVRATNAVSGVERRLACKVEKPGSAALPCATLHTLVAAMPEGEIGLLLKDTTAELRCHGARRYKLAGLNPADYPPSRQFDEAQLGSIAWCAIQGSVLGDALRKVSSCVTPERPYTNGVFVVLDRDKPLIVGMHPHRCSIAGPGVDDAHTEPRDGQEKGVFVPALVLRPFQALCETAGSQPIEIGQTPTEVLIRAPGALLHASLPEAPYPPWRRLFSNPGPREWTVDANELAEVIRAVTVATTYSRHIKLEFASGAVRVSFAGKQQEAADRAAAEGSKPMVFFMQAQYLQDTLRSVAGRVLIQGEAERDLVMLQGPDFRATIMPLDPDRLQID